MRMNRLFLVILVVGIANLFPPAFDIEPEGLANGGILTASTYAFSPVPSGDGKLIYADFEQPLNAGRPVSSRGGLVQITAYQGNPSRQSRIKGAAQITPPAPELVRVQKDSPNKSAAFDYELLSPNPFAGVGLEIHDQPDRDGKTVPDDVSGYQFLTLQAYVTGVQAIRLEFISQGQGINIPLGDPQATFKVTQGFNTYRVPLKSIAQPFWAMVKVSPKEVLKRLTAIKLSVYCEDCTTAIKGTVVVDNIVFEK